MQRVLRSVFQREASACRNGNYATGATHFLSDKSVGNLTLRFQIRVWFRWIFTIWIEIYLLIYSITVRKFLRRQGTNSNKKALIFILRQFLRLFNILNRLTYFLLKSESVWVGCCGFCVGLWSCALWVRCRRGGVFIVLPQQLLVLHSSILKPRFHL